MDENYCILKFSLSHCLINLRLSSVKYHIKISLHAFARALLTCVRGQASQVESARAQRELTKKCAGDFSPARDKLSNLDLLKDVKVEEVHERERASTKASKNVAKDDI